MLYIAENLRKLRKEKEHTQEVVAEMLGVSAQSVSKWERGDTLPDITLLPALANLYKVSVDKLLGMDKINEQQVKDSIFFKGHDHLRDNDFTAAIENYSDALKVYPNDEGIMSDLAMAFALKGGKDNLSQAITLCERVLSNGQSDKVHHTTRAALCYIYYKVGEKDRAVTVARKLPHLRESREVLLDQFKKEPAADDIDTYLKFVAIGELDEQDIIEIDFGIDMVPVCTEYDLVGRIESLRNENDAPMCNEGFRKLPQIRIRDKIDMEPKRLRVRYYADYLIDKEYEDKSEAADEIIKVLRKMAQTNISKL
jgi:transcriptional regulator with XRE-family HTH domain